ncbi:SRPBCC family protein [Pseudonocardia endophytica]|uniref:Polyketide cyclase/dehydrase/lipid transport protein n=1 Tax=Pseudonocardia endophytica TaxID=401976 RepID=A0A4R1HMG0_PSEEN|nr:SRPBCC family protein [Pseudonocardia endophytica]TCK21510.1 polyketide cyclase/dehydrase/lipid transport protein [Pseudonocardia endophytica]
MADERLEARRTIAAPPEAVFAILRDPQGHVTIDSSGMLMSATGSPVSAVGDEFVVHMDREALGDRPIGEYQVTVHITRYEQDREIAWTIEGGLLDPPLGHVYGYRLEPTGDGGTDIVSYYDWSEINERYRGRIEFPVINPESLRATLGILTRTVANPSSTS